MKLYLITAKNATNEAAKWAGSQAEAASVRKEFISEGYKRVEMDTLDVDVPTNKEGLLGFLNVLAVNPSLAAASEKLTAA
jgi:hypothetical protein